MRKSAVRTRSGGRDDVARRLGGRIRKLRVQRGLTQADLAGEAFTPFAVSRIERGASLPSLDLLLHVSRKLGIRLRHVLPPDL